MLESIQTRTFCAEVNMTPSQCNEVIEDNLGHLEPMLKSTLAMMESVDRVLANGGFNWRLAFSRAKKKVSDE